MRMPFHLTLVQRVALLGTLSVVLVAVLAGTAFVQQREALRFADAQSEGLPAVRALLSLSARVAEHRGMSAAVLGGDTSFAARREAKQAEVGAGFDVVDRLLSVVTDPRVASLREGLRAEWTALAGAVAAGKVSGADSLRRHGELVARQLKLLDEVAASSGLLLDPDPALYALIVSTLEHQPEAAERIGQIRGNGIGMLGKPAFDPLDKLRLAALLDSARAELDAAMRTLERAFAARPGMAATLGSPAAQAREAFAKAAAIATSRIVDADRPTGGTAEFYAAMTQAIDAQAALGAASIDVLSEVFEARHAHARRTLMIVVAASALGLAFALWMSVSMARSVRRNAAAAVATAQALAAGDFTVNVDAGGADEFGRIATALDEARVGIARAVRDVRDSVEAIATASTQISQGSHDLSRRTEQQAAALQQTAASMEELTGAVLQSSENARQADAMAGAASEGARAGGESMREVVATMAEISSASQRIANIVGVIDGIAFQTNILALNAAVEAARAGEQGRGFAVVAAEVRALASRSSQAAREIRTMIEASTGQVRGGERVIAEAGRGIDAVVGQAGQVSALVSAITAAAVQQNAGLAQVGDAISSLDEATQQNAALAEESAAAAESLRGQSERLATAVGAFRL